MKTFELYRGLVRLDFYEQGHKYQITQNGATTTPTGVTTILRVLNKPALMLWPMYEALGYLRQTFLDDSGIHYTGHHFHKEMLEAETKHLSKSEKGKGVGSEVHEAIELVLNILKNSDGEVDITIHKDNVSPAALKALGSFTKWLMELQPKVLATEQPVYSKSHDYAGTFDALLEIDGQTVLCDIKTSNTSRTAPLGIYAENFIQLGAYSLAYKEESPEAEIDDLMVINANKTGKLSTLRASQLGLSVSDCEQAFIQCLKLHNLMKDLSDKLKEKT